MISRSEGINNLRFITALTVLLTHFGVPEGSLNLFVETYHTVVKYFFWSNSGLHFGVIIFVVMSGFLIHSTSSKVDSKIYLVKRFLRIYPLFFISSVVGLSFHGFSEIDSFLYNIFLLSSFVPNEGPPGNPVLITVVVEMVIYIFYLILRKFNSYKVLMLLFFIYALNIYIYNKFGVDGEYIQRNFFSLIFYWYIGAASYDFFILSNKKIKPIKLMFYLFVYVIFTNLDYTQGLHYIYSVLLAIISAIFISFIFQSNSFKFSKISKFSMLINLLGESAYSIYAWHIIILVIFNKFLGNLNSLTYLILIVSTLILSILSYFSIEKYFNDKRKRIITYLSEFKNLPTADK